MTMRKPKRKVERQMPGIWHSRMHKLMRKWNNLRTDNKKRKPVKAPAVPA